MRKFLLVPIFITVILLGLPQQTFAHVLKVDNTIGAVLHILPDDAPTSKVPITYELAFRDYGGSFAIENCDCNVAYMASGKAVATQQLGRKTPTTSTNTYTFPAAGVYTFHITGKPINGVTFQSFTLDYEVRVSGGQADKRPFPVSLWIGAGMAIGLVVLAAVVTEYIGNQPRK